MGECLDALTLTLPEATHCLDRVVGRRRHAYLMIGHISGIRIHGLYCYTSKARSHRVRGRDSLPTSYLILKCRNITLTGKKLNRKRTTQRNINSHINRTCITSKIRGGHEQQKMSNQSLRQQIWKG